MNNYHDNIFVNCPFDEEYQSIFHAIVFTIFDCGFVARCALEEENSGNVRYQKILRIIEDCKYGIHDLSRTDLCEINQLPRFNMPFELGLFLGAHYFGDETQKKKNSLIFDLERFRYQKFISDIAGQDIKAHNNDKDKVIRAVRNWLRSASNRTTIPGHAAIIGRFNKFNIELPAICKEADLDFNDLIFNDYAIFVEQWLKNETNN